MHDQSACLLHTVHNEPETFAIVQFCYRSFKFAKYENCLLVTDALMSQQVQHLRNFT
eukprot:SAG31_NODE_2388_length_5808_cov_2.772640_3_plen_57_part_00